MIEERNEGEKVMQLIDFTEYINIEVGILGTKYGVEKV
jgi:hypothetical protein